jgi:hypothetical protein
MTPFQNHSYFVDHEMPLVPDESEQPMLPGIPERETPVGPILGRMLEAKTDFIEVSRRELEEWRDDLLHAQQLEDLDLIIDAISDKIDR